VSKKILFPFFSDEDVARKFRIALINLKKRS
jgi:hypothetical protein